MSLRDLVHEWGERWGIPPGTKLSADDREEMIAALLTEDASIRRDITLERWLERVMDKGLKVLAARLIP